MTPVELVIAPSSLVSLFGVLVLAGLVVKYGNQPISFRRRRGPVPARPRRAVRRAARKASRTGKLIYSPAARPAEQRAQAHPLRLQDGPRDWTPTPPSD